MAGPNAILAPLLFTEFPGADLKVSCDFSLRKSQFLAARPQTPAYRNIHRLCHITYSVIAGEKLALSKGCFREMQPIEQKTLDFIAEIDRVDDSDSVRLLFQRFLEVEIGFTNVVCLKVPNASETLNSTIYFNTRPEPWTEHYVEANHIFSDPMVRELYKTYDHYAWSDVLNRRKLERDDLRIVQEAGEFGMREGFVVPIRGIETIICVTDAFLLPTMQSLHWRPRPLGLPSKYPEGIAVGVAIEISEDTLDRLRATHGIEGAVLDEPLERALLAASLPAQMH